jgi:hypothetical protein
MLGLLLITVATKEFVVPKSIPMDTDLPKAFLLEQFEFHEAINLADSLNDITQLEKLEAQLLEQQFQQLKQLENLFNKHDAFENLELVNIRTTLKILSFYSKILDLVDKKIIKHTHT